MSSLPEGPQPPISEDDRDAAVQRLQEGFADGHISYEEMDDQADCPASLPA